MDEITKKELAEIIGDNKIHLLKTTKRICFIAFFILLIFKIYGNGAVRFWDWGTIFYPILLYTIIYILFIIYSLIKVFKKTKF